MTQYSHEGQEHRRAKVCALGDTGANTEESHQKPQQLSFREGGNPDSKISLS